jgi:hypothetical protein
MTDVQSDSSMDDSLEMFKRRSRMARWRQYLGEEASKEWADLILIITCFISGLVDSAVFNVWSCFVSMQTGKYIRGGRRADSFDTAPQKKENENENEELTSSL